MKGINYSFTFLAESYAICEIPPTPLHSNINYYERSYKLQCNDGYELSSGNTSVEVLCLSDDIHTYWESIDTTCYGIVHTQFCICTINFDLQLDQHPNYFLNVLESYFSIYF